MIVPAVLLRSARPSPVAALIPSIAILVACGLAAPACALASAVTVTLAMTLTRTLAMTLALSMRTVAVATRLAAFATRPSPAAAMPVGRRTARQRSGVGRGGIGGGRRRLAASCGSHRGVAASGTAIRATALIATTLLIASASPVAPATTILVTMTARPPNLLELLFLGGFGSHVGSGRRGSSFGCAFGGCGG